MTDWEFDRRDFLKIAGGGAAVSLGAALGIRELSDDQSSEESTSTPSASPAPTATATPGEQTATPAETATATDQSPTPSDSPEQVDIRDFGAKVDGETDDTQAILEALDAVEPGGTVVLPPGTIRISPQNNGYDPTTSRAAIPIRRPDDGITIEGKHATPSSTHLVMGPGHEDNHKGIRIPPDASSDSGDDHSGLTIRNLTLDGRWWEQQPGSDKFPNGFAADIRGESRDVTFENCIVKNWATNGGLMAAPGIRVKNCEFVRNGYGKAQFGKNGHGFNVRTDGRSGRVIAENCLFLNNVGDGIDARAGKVTIRRCVFKGNGYGIKLKQKTEDVLMEHCRMVDSGRMHIRCVPTGEEGTGRLRLNSVVFDGSPWPAIHLNKRPGTFEGDNILVKNANTEQAKDSGVFIDADSSAGDRSVDVGTLSVHNVNGSALEFRHADGTIETLNHSSTDGPGDSDDVEIGTINNSDPISVETPSWEEVGRLSKSN